MGGARSRKKMRQVLLLFSILFQLVAARHTRYWLLRLTNNDRADQIAKECGLVNRGLVGRFHNVFQYEFKNGKDNKPYNNITESLSQYPEVNYVIQEETQKHSPRTLFSLPNDPQWKYQWPWYNTGQSGATKGNDINVIPIWIEGITGHNSTALVIDNGIQLDHPDLHSNINVSLCYSTLTHSTDINPQSSLKEDNHGTSCAGEIAMIHDNGICGAGVAYGATIAGYQVDFSELLPSEEVDAFHHFNDEIQVYSNSWGPEDNGFTVQGPQTLAQEALQFGVESGRNGLGSIYVFSSGNGGQYDDSCAADGYASNRYTISVGSADQAGRQAFYDEDCSGKMAVTYSYNSAVTSDQVVTTYPNSGCVKSFTGTSASAPLMTGVILLALEVNPNLSWRDVQYLIAYTSKSSPLVDGNFVTNGAGLRVSSKFGFGAIDAEALVTRARYWSPVTKEINYTAVNPNINRLQAFQVTKSNSFKYTYSMPSGNIKYLEHVILTATFSITTSGGCYDYESSVNDHSVIDHSGPRRGDASIRLCSPSGTCSTLLPKRSKDYVNCYGYDDWPFISVHFWGEDPSGDWTITMSFSSDSGSAVITYMSLTFYGINEKPQDIVSSCDSACASSTGCSFGNGSKYCDSCGDGYYRNSSTLECVRSCESGACVVANTCVFYDGKCPDSGLSETDIIIISVACFLFVVCVILCIVCVCCCCCCSSSSKRYRRLSFKQGTSDDGNLYVPYVEPAIV